MKELSYALCSRLTWSKNKGSRSPRKVEEYFGFDVRLSACKLSWDNVFHLISQSQKVSLGSLKNMTKDNVSFGSLKKLIISGYEDIMSLFSSSIAANLVNLRELRIQKCDEMVQVIEDEEEEKKAVSGGDQNTLLFPNLQELKLEDLCKLVSFCGWKCNVELPSLKKLHINRCPDMKSFTLGFLSAPNLEDFTTNLPNYLEDGVLNVSFDSLKILRIKGNGNPLYSYKIHASLFNGLQELTIYRYKGSMSLFSPSIAGNLVSLRKLKIYFCDEMVTVIEDEKEEENVVSSGGAQTTMIILFPKLQELELSSLSQLESFCEWKCDVRLPSLKKVEITCCENMKIFTRGPLITPNLESVKIDYYKELEIAHKDLNGALIKEKQKEETTYDDEEEGNGGEIEEEQNWKTTTPAAAKEEEEEEEEGEGRKGEIEEEQNS